MIPVPAQHLRHLVALALGTLALVIAPLPPLAVALGAAVLFYFMIKWGVDAWQDYHRPSTVR